MTRRILVLLAASALLAGCVSGYFGALPQAELLTRAIPPGPRPSAYIELARSDHAGMTARGDLERAADAASGTPGLFSWFTRDRERGAGADYRVALSLECYEVPGSREPRSTMDKLGRSIQMGTLCVVPCGSGQIACRMSASVARRGDGQEKTYEVRETIGSKLYGFYAIPVGLSRDPESILENELRTLYRQMLDAHAFSAGAG